MKKKSFILLAVSVTLFVFFTGCRIQSVEEHYGETESVSNDREIGTVMLSITCLEALKNREKLDPAIRDGNYLPEDGILLKETEFALTESDTVFDVLSRAVKAERIQMEYTGVLGGTVYVQGIGYLYEFACGPLSGWMYRVNGVFPGTGCSAYVLSDGDVIEWIYSCDLGHDVGDTWQEGASE